MIRRRMFCQALAGSGVAVSPTARAQTPARVYRLGILDPGRPANLPRVDVPTWFDNELARLGLVEGVNLVIDVRTANGNPALLDARAAELVAARPDVIFSPGGFAGTNAAKKATTTIPIVFAAVGEPVAAGLVSSLARPGGNLTGGTIPAELELKRVQILMEVLGTTASVVHLTTPLSEARKAAFVQAMAATSKPSAARLQFVEVKQTEDLAPAFEQMARQRVGGVAIRLTPFSANHAPEITALVAKHRLPAIGDGTQYTDAGLLMSYSIHWPEVFRLAANYVYKVLKGAQPADLPIEQVTKFDFVVNQKTAKTLGIRIPQSVLITATQVIE